jgi:putative drug exporter of the RND superfamily
MIEGLFERLAGFVVRYRWLVIAFWGAVLAAAMVALPSLGSEVNSDPSLFLSSNARSVQAASLGAPLLGKSTTSKITIVAARADGPLTSADIAAITREADLARQVSAVTSVRPAAVSPGDRAVQLDVTVSKDQTDVAGLRPVVSDLEATFPSAGAPPGLQLHLAGQVATNAANNKSANKAMGRITLYSIVFILVLLLILLRSPVALLVTFAPSVVALLVSQKFVAGLGAHGLQISSITQTLLIVLILGAGTDYGLFLVYRFREELRAGSPPRIAVVRALTRVGESITASAGTVILALLTLLFASFGVFALAGGGIMGGQLQAIGLGLAVGVLLDTFVVRTLLVPSIVVLLGRLNWWPSRLSRSGPPGASPGQRLRDVGDPRMSRLLAADHPGSTPAGARRGPRTGAPTSQAGTPRSH